MTTTAAKKKEAAQGEGDIMTDTTSQTPSVPHTPEKKQYSENAAQATASSDGVVESTSSIAEDRVFTPTLQRSGELEYSPVEPTDRTFPVKSIVWVDPAIQNAHSLPTPIRSGGITIPPPPSPDPRRPLVPTALAPDTSGTVGSSSSAPPSEDSVFGSVTCAATPVELVHHTPSGSSQKAIIQEDRSSQGDSAKVDGSSTKRKRPGAMSGDDGSRIENVLDPSPDADHFPGSVMTGRFKHVVTEGGHAVSTGGNAEFVRCEDEPIRTPGAIQGFGALVALLEEEPGRFVVRLASENTGKIIGYTPQQLFQLESIMEILSEEQQDNLLHHIDSVRDENFNPRLSGPEIFNTSISSPDGKRVKLWCAIHINTNRQDFIVCEFEHKDDLDHPLSYDSTPSSRLPESTTAMTYTVEEIAQSTQSMSKPLKFPRRARTGNIEPNAMQMFDLMGQVQDQLDAATNMDDFLKILVGIVKELAGYHRVMIYRFDSSFNGKVVTELVDTAHTGDLYLGLHFPATDIPSQARELYKVSKMRLLYDRDLETVRIVCRTQGDLNTPLDMTHCYLRAMSPIHLKYLANMAVRSSMSLSLKVFGNLWGLVSCHTYGPHGTRPPFPLRKMCELISNVASRNIERLSYETTLQAQKLINSQLINKSASEYVIASEDDLLKMFEADWGIVSILGETRTFGHISQSQESFAIVEYLRMRKLADVLASHDIATDFLDLQYPPGFSVLGGILYVPLSVDGASFMVLFRKAQAQEVKWSGNPHEQKYKNGNPGLLEPRTSFKMWREVVTGRSREWSAETVELASLLCAVYGKFIQAWRQRETSSQSSRLTQLLLANSAHQVRTPLNAIINYLEVALEGPLDQETRNNLAESHSASKSLVYVINDLLDLTKTEQGLVLTKGEVFDLPACISSATDSFSEDARRKGINYETDMHSALPRYVCGDKSQVRQAISNIIANAFQNTSNGFVQVASYLADAGDARTRVEISVQDSGVGMAVEEIDSLFHDLEQISNAVPAGDREGTLQAGSRLGLGLAVVARVVRNMDGQLRVKSELGQGSCFVIQLPFNIPDEEGAPKGPKAIMEPKDTLPDHQPPTLAKMPSYASGEITLVGRQNNDSLPATGGTEEDTQVIVPRQGVAEVCDAENLEERSEDRDTSEFHALTEVRSSAILAPEPSTEGLDKEETPLSSAPESGGTTEAAGSGMAGTSEEQTPLRVLIAEDDPINFKILKKRLTKLGHEVHHAMNGEDCAAMYCQKSDSFDIILMDIQMPIMDGLASTKAIRSWEGDRGSNLSLSPLARRNERIPIFAVSASLVEAKRAMYMDMGFDGWIPKPIDFKSLQATMMGIADDKARLACAYAPGRWEVGGWF